MGSKLALVEEEVSEAFVLESGDVGDVDVRFNVPGSLVEEGSLHAGVVGEGRSGFVAVQFTVCDDRFLVLLDCELVVCGDVATNEKRLFAGFYFSYETN